MEAATRCPKWLLHAADRVLGLRDVSQIYAEALSDRHEGTFAERVLRALGVNWTMAAGDVAGIPRTGPVVITANHPFGGVEALVLKVIFDRVRPDVKILANHLLGRIPELSGDLILVDPFRGEGAVRRNLNPIRSAVSWLQSGGALLVFPAGEVAHLRTRGLRVRESDWSATVAGIIRRTRADVAPVHVAGRNSMLFQLAGLVHPMLRTAMLARELLNKRGRCIEIAVGSPIPSERLDQYRADAALIEHLRQRTLLLGARASRQTSASPVNARPRSHETDQPVEAPVDAVALRAEILALSPDALLLESGDFHVYCCPARSIPNALREIGRLREVTFRQVGEGTGRSIDLDQFDQHYLHLFLWHEPSGRIAGAYRLGLTDEIVPRFGVSGLYTSTLFRFKRSLIDQFTPAIELGRSFVVAEHQRSYLPLLLLWKGIGRFILRHPRYRILFGAVSISAEYESMTKRLLVAFLRANHFDVIRSNLAQPRRPPRFSRDRESELRSLARTARSLDDVDNLVREIESGRRGVPILVRQYLRLGAKLLGFNVDPDFGNVIDGLFYVDLANVDRSILDRFMGREEAASFLCESSAVPVSVG